jgi:hypothetical protein
MKVPDVAEHDVRVCGSSVGPAEHLLADGEAGHGAAGCDHSAGEVRPLPRGKIGRERRGQGTLADGDLARVDSGGHHLDQHLVRTDVPAGDR